MGVYKPLLRPVKSVNNTGMTRELIRQFLHSYWSRATARTVVPHHAIRATRTAFPNFVYPRAAEGLTIILIPFHSWRGVVLKEVIEQL